MIPVIMPRQGQSVESCVITKWHKKPGDEVKPGEIIFSYETDKAAFDEEAKAGGVLLAILREEGDDVPCLENVCLLGEAGEDITAYSASQSSVASPVVHEVAVNEVVAPSRSIEAEDIPSGKISPRARALAEKRGVDWTHAQASGPHGRVIARDMQAQIDAGNVITPAAQGVVAAGVPGSGLGGRVSLRDQGAEPVADVNPAPVADVRQAPPSPAKEAFEAESWDEPLPNIRKVIARTMQESLTTMAQLTHNATYDATEVLALRKRCKEQGQAFGMEGVTIGDIIVYAVSRTLTQPGHVHLNAHFLGGSMRFFRDVHLGIAVDTPRGLMVPTLREANRKSLQQISQETKALAAACQTGAIDPDLLSGASFTVSNLGAFEIEHFTPVINPPQTGILGVNTIQQRVREVDGALALYPAMTLSLTYDHRALDGAPASRFLRDLKRNLENIQMLLGGGVFHV